MSSNRKTDREKKTNEGREVTRSKDSDKHLSDVKSTPPQSGSLGSKPLHNRSASRSNNKNLQCRELGIQLSKILSTVSLLDDPNAVVATIKSLNLSLDGDDKKVDFKCNAATNGTSSEMTTATASANTRSSTAPASTRSATPTVTTRTVPSTATTRSGTPIATTRTAPPTATTEASMSVAHSPPKISKKVKRSKIVTPSYVGRHLLKAEAQVNDLTQKVVAHMRFVRCCCHVAETENNNSFMLSEDDSCRDVSISSSQSLSNIADSIAESPCDKVKSKNPIARSHKCPLDRSKSEGPKTKSLVHEHCKHDRDQYEDRESSQSRRPPSTDRTQSEMLQKFCECKCSKHLSKCPECNEHVGKPQGRHSSDTKKGSHCSVHRCLCNICQHHAHCGCLDFKPFKEYANKSETLADGVKHLCTVPVYYYNIEHGIGDGGASRLGRDTEQHQRTTRSYSCNARCPSYWHQHFSYKQRPALTAVPHCCCNHYCPNQGHSNGRRPSDLNTEDVCRHRCSHGTVDSKRRSGSNNRRSESYSPSVGSSRRTVSKRNDSQSRRSSSNKPTTSKGSVDVKKVVDTKHRRSSKTCEEPKRRSASSSLNQSKSGHKRHVLSNDKKDGPEGRSQTSTKEKSKHSTSSSTQTEPIKMEEEKSPDVSIKTTVTNDTPRIYVENFKLSSSSTPKNDVSKSQSDTELSTVSIETSDLIARCESICRHLQKFVKEASKKNKSKQEKKSDSKNSKSEEKNEYYYLNTTKSDSSLNDTDAISLTPMDNTQKLRNYQNYVKMYDEQVNSPTEGFATMATADEKPLENYCRELADPTKPSTQFIKQPTGLINSDMCIQEATHQRKSTLTERTTTAICKLTCSSTIEVERKTETVAVAESSTRARHQIADNLQKPSLNVHINDEHSYPKNSALEEQLQNPTVQKDSSRWNDIDFLAELQEIKRFIRDITEKSPPKSRFDHDFSEELPHCSRSNRVMANESAPKSRFDHALPLESSTENGHDRNVAQISTLRSRYDFNMTSELPQCNLSNRIVANESDPKTRFDHELALESPLENGYERDITKESSQSHCIDLMKELPQCSRYNRDMADRLPPKNRLNRELALESIPENGYGPHVAEESTQKKPYNCDLALESLPKNLLDHDMANESHPSSRYNRNINIVDKKNGDLQERVANKTSAKRVQIVVEDLHSEQGLTLGGDVKHTYMTNDNSYKVKETSMSKRVYFDEGSNMSKEYYDEKTYEASIPSRRMNSTETYIEQQKQRPTQKPCLANIRESDSEECFYDALPVAVNGPTDRKERREPVLGKPPLPSCMPQETSRPPAKKLTPQERGDQFLAKYREYLATQKNRQERTNVCRTCPHEDTAFQAAAMKAAKTLKHLMKYPMDLMQSALVGLVSGTQAHVPSADEVEEYNQYNQIYEMNGKFFYNVCRSDVKMIVKQDKVYAQETREDRIFRIPMLTLKPNIRLQRKLHSLQTYELEYLENINGCPCMVEMLVDVLTKSRGED